MSLDTTEEKFVVTARKWRPMRFSDVVGQEHVTTTLRNAILTKRIHHAYLFNGPRGVGKTTSARILARAVNCPNLSAEAEPCNDCPACRDVIDGRSIDVIEIDGASNNSVEDIRKLRENAKYPPVSGRYKMYIIDEVHMLSTSAFNALLKTLEEPPPHLLFVFATTEPHKVPATIISRCQRFDFRRMEIESITRQLALISKHEGLSIDEESLVAIAKKAEGSMRDSQSVFDQVVAFCGKDIRYADVNAALHLIDEEFFFHVGRAIREHDIAAMFEISREIIAKGYDIQEFLQGLLEHFRNILTILATGTTKLIQTSQVFLDKFELEAAHFSQADVLRLMNIVTTTEYQLKNSPQPRIKFEVALVQMATLDSTVQIGELLEEIRALKKGIPAGNPVPQSAPQQVMSPKPPERPQPAARETPVSYSAPPKAAPAPEPVPVKKEEPAPGFPPFQAGKATEEKAPEQEPPAAGKKYVSAQELQARWNQFVKALSSPFAGTKMLLASGDIRPQFLDNELILHVAVNFGMEDLSQKKGAFMEELAKFYGGAVELRLAGSEGARQAPSQSPAAHVRESAPSPENSAEHSSHGTETAEPQVEEVAAAQNSSPADAHPVEKAIVELFGAKEIPLPIMGRRPGGEKKQ